MAEGMSKIGQKSTADVDWIIRNAAFSMEVEGFIITPDQKEDVRRVLRGELDAEVLRMSYLEEAQLYGKHANASR